MVLNHESLQQVLGADNAEGNAFFRILESFQEAMKLQVQSLPVEWEGGCQLDQWTQPSIL